jgi:hypothetical protein
MLFGWTRSIPGREQISNQHFQDFVQYLGGLEKGGKIQGFDIVFLDIHGGDLNGFFLIRGESAQLDAMAASKEWETHMTRASLHLQGAGAVRGVTGKRVMERMNLWQELLPR